LATTTLFWQTFGLHSFMRSSEQFLGCSDL
jgi:hypothetical protein